MSSIRYISRYIYYVWECIHIIIHTKWLFSRITYTRTIFKTRNSICKNITYKIIISFFFFI